MVSTEFATDVMRMLVGAAILSVEDYAQLVGESVPAVLDDRKSFVHDWFHMRRDFASWFISLPEDLRQPFVEKLVQLGSM